MIYTKALSMDVHFYERVQLSKIPMFIHSVFARTINIMIDHDLYTIASNQLDNAPSTIKIDLVSFEQFNFTSSDSITHMDSKINIADSLKIDLNTAIPWKSHLPQYPSDEYRLKNNLPFAMEFVIKHGKADWLRGESAGGMLFYDEMGRMLRERTTRLTDNFLFEDETTNVKRAMQLVGLGQGLTPSGDDFLVGMMLAFSTVENNFYNKQTWMSQVIKESKDKTNIISYSALKHAELGEARESIGLLLQALFDGTNERVKHELLNVMKIGSSSGTEISWGILNGLSFFLK